MEERLKKRLLGAVVLVSLVVIFVPMLIDDGTDAGRITETNIPPRPPQLEAFESRVMPVAGGDRSGAAEPEDPQADQPAADSVDTGDPIAPAGPSSEVGAQPETRVGLSAWIIQIGSFSSRENADKLAERLKAGRLPAFVEQAYVNKRPTYRVRVGPEIDRKIADDMAARIAREFDLKGAVIHYP